MNRASQARSALLQAALNGSRTPAEHPAIPRTPEELAAAARSVVEAGGEVLHLHAYDDGVETLAADACAAALRAVRTACPATPISLTSSADTEPDPQRRLALVAGWAELPELVTANQGESGIVELCEHLIGRGVGTATALRAGRCRHEGSAAGTACEPASRTQRCCRTAGSRPTTPRSCAPRWR